VGQYVFYTKGTLSVAFTYPGGTGRDYLALNKLAIEQPHKVLFMPHSAPGVWFNDEFTYTEGVTELVLIQGASGTATPTHKVAGTCQRQGVPFAGEVQVVSVLEQAHLGSATANPSTGDWQVDIALAGAVFVFVSMPYGAAFAPDLVVNPGDTLHPPTPNGFIYQVTQAGTLGPAPSEWPTSTPLVSGTAKLEPTAYLAPEIHGPILPAPIT